jgi:AP2 domain/HNH endonuclease
MPKRIPITSQDCTIVAHAIVDDADFTWLSHWSWTLTRGYARRSGPRNSKPQIILMHQQIMDFPGKPIDHINDNKLDNRRSNLRTITPGQNRKGPNKTGLSGYRGVSFHHQSGKWRVYATVKGKQHSGGYYTTPEEANTAAIALRKRISL